jgi:hypothetical protein
MAERKPFLLRVDPAVLEALQRWAADDLRSLNGQIEYVLREALARAGRLKIAASDDGAAAEPMPVAPITPVRGRRRKG